VVLVDDAHLIDAESLRALLFDARRLLANCALVLLVVRGSTEDSLPEEWRKLAAGSNGGVLTVGPLAPLQISELALALGVAVTPDAAGRLWEHTRGSPLYAHAVFRELPRDERWQHEPRPRPTRRTLTPANARGPERRPDRSAKVEEGGRPEPRGPGSDVVISLSTRRRPPPTAPRTHVRPGCADG
jgi:hypothetical protein